MNFCSSQPSGGVTRQNGIMRKLMHVQRLTSFLFVAFALSSVPVLSAQASDPSLPDAPQPVKPAEYATVRNTPRNLLKDQEAIWTSPLRLRDTNALGPIALVLGTTLLITTDHQVMSDHFKDANTNKHAATASNGLVGAFVAAPAGFYLLGKARHSEEAQETGILGGEAIADSLAVNAVLRIASRRERPTVDDAKGKFFQDGVNFNSSFASNHSVIAWSSAAVIASEYNGPLTKIVAYGAATGVSMARIASRDHFPSDVLVGSAVGWMIGRYVYHRHHRDAY